MNLAECLRAQIDSSQQIDVNAHFVSYENALMAFLITESMVTFRANKAVRQYNLELLWYRYYLYSIFTVYYL